MNERVIMEELDRMDETVKRQLDRQVEHALQAVARLHADDVCELLRQPGFGSPWDLATALAKGFVLSHFVLGDSTRSFEPVHRAMRDFHDAMSKEERRRKRYEKEGGNPQRTFLEPQALFEVLVLERCTPVEKEQERRRKSLSSEDVLIRYTKHLLEHTLDLGSLRVNLAVSRFLLDYTPKEVWTTQRLLEQEREPVKKGDYSSDPLKRKIAEVTQTLGQALSTRFEHLVVEDSGEVPGKLGRRAASGQEIKAWKGAVDTLRRLLSPCRAMESTEDQSAAQGPRGLFPTEEDPVNWDVLRQHGESAADLGRVEAARMTALLLPEIHSLITSAIGLPDPTERLQVPTFVPAIAHPTSRQDPPEKAPPTGLGGRIPDRPLGFEEISTLAARLSLDRRVRLDPPRELEIEIDGEAWGSWPFREFHRLDLRLPRATRRVQLVADPGGDSVPVATFRFGDLLEERRLALDLESGERLTLQLDPGERHDLDGASAGWQVSFRSEPVAASTWDRCLHAMGHLLGVLRPESTVFEPRRLVALAVTALLAFGLSYFFWVPTPATDVPPGPTSGVVFRQLIPGDLVRSGPDHETLLAISKQASGMVLVIPSDFLPEAAEYRLLLEEASGSRIWSAESTHPIDEELTVFVPVKWLREEAYVLHVQPVEPAAGSEPVTIPFRLELE